MAKRSDYQAWRKALGRAITNGLTAMQLNDGRYCVSSGSKPGVGYLTDGRTCSCPAGVNGNPVCQHSALVWHLAGRLRSDAQLIAAAEDAATDAMALVRGTSDAEVAAWVAAMDQLDAAMRELERAGVNWDADAFVESLIDEPGLVPAHVPTFGGDVMCGSCHHNWWTWRAPDSGLALCQSCLEHAESFAGFGKWSATDRAARAEALGEALTAMAAD